MKHIQNKNDWFYEFKPQLMVVFGVIGVFAKMFMPAGNETILMRVAQGCGIVLLILAIKIMDWRKTHREAFRHLMRARRS